VNVLNIFFSENKYGAVCFMQKVTHLTPTIFGINNSYNITVDNVVVLAACTCSFQKAVQAWFAAFFIFSIKYPSKLTNTCKFVEKILLKGCGKAPSKVRKWANRLL